MLELCPVNFRGGVRVGWGVPSADPSRCSQWASHGGAQFNSIEVAAVERVTGQSVQSQIQVQQGLMNRPLHLENTRMNRKTTSA